MKKQVIFVEVGSLKFFRNMDKEVLTCELHNVPIRFHSEGTNLLFAEDGYYELLEVYRGGYLLQRKLEISFKEISANGWRLVEANKRLNKSIHIQRLLLPFEVQEKLGYVRRIPKEGMISKITKKTKTASKKMATGGEAIFAGVMAMVRKPKK